MLKLYAYCFLLVSFAKILMDTITICRGHCFVIQSIMELVQTNLCLYADLQDQTSHLYFLVLFH